jgi:hypothetical protein
MPQGSNIKHKCFNEKHHQFLLERLTTVCTRHPEAIQAISIKHLHSPFPHRKTTQPPGGGCEKDDRK